MAPFDDQPVLTGATLQLYPLKRDDFDGLFAAAAHAEIWAGHPAKDRHLPEVFGPYFEFLIAAGGCLAIVSRREGKIIGCSRYYSVAERPHSISIGYTFLNHLYWGGSTNFALKQLMLDHAFATFPEVWFDIGPDNLRSQRATLKLGAVHSHDARFDLGGGRTDWKCYRLTRAAWAAIVAGRQ